MHHESTIIMNLVKLMHALQAPKVHMQFLKQELVEK